MGIIMFFYSNEHEPIHIHARRGEFESKAEFFLEDGEIVAIRITNVRGYDPLKGTDLKNLKTFLEYYAKNIVQKWSDYFVQQKSINFEKVSKRLK